MTGTGGSGRSSQGGTQGSAGASGTAGGPAGGVAGSGTMTWTGGGAVGPGGAVGTRGGAGAGTAGAAGAAGAGGHGGLGSGGSASAGRGGGGAGTIGVGGGTTGTFGGGGMSGAGGAAALPPAASVISLLRLANSYFVAKWPNAGTAIDSSHPSNIWTRAVYFEGLMGLYSVDPQQSDLDYAVQWGTSHNWGLNDGPSTTSANDQCAGQTYIDLYNINQQPVRIAAIKANIDMVVASPTVNAWTWVDAIQMAMPVFAKLGVLEGSTSYFDKMYSMYSYTRNELGAAGLYNTADQLWWRDTSFVNPPYVEPNGRSCYWSRGNGWVYAALTRVLDIIPATESHRAEYLSDFQAMSEALRGVQRNDGFWNVSLFDPTDYGGDELTGTSLFAYGMAWGVRTGNLDSLTYLPVVAKAWAAMASSVHSNGFLGWVQGTGKQPWDGQPITFNSVPDYEDFGLGCFLLGGSQVARLAGP
jgi:unsaturated rhamnogalacturonyl hydrolase